MEERERDFLPPEAPGPEPDLEKPPPGPPPQTHGYPPAPPGQPYYPPPPTYAHPPAWGNAQPHVPDNGPAVAGFVFSVAAIGLLVLSGGLSSVVSIGCAIAGIVLGRNGRRKVDAGETPKHRGLAQAGYVIGWVSLALAVLATIAWILVIAFAAGDEDFNWDSAQAFWG